MSSEPLSREDVAAARAARQTAVYVVGGTRALVEVTGPDAARYLEAMCTRDLSGLDPGEIRYAALVDDRARYVADFWIWRMGEAWWLEGESAVAPGLAERLRRFAVADEVEVELRPERALFHVEGPGATALAREVLGLALDERAAGEGEPGAMAWARRSRFGEEGFTLAAGEPQEIAGWADRARSLGLVEASPAAQETLRLEAGRVRGGVDVTEKDLLPEAGLWGAISLDKGCFPGQEIVRRIVSRGEVRRRLVGFVEEAQAEPAAPAALAATSIAWSPAFGGHVGLGWVRAEHAAPGTPVRVARGADGETLFDARVAALPLSSGPRSASPDVPGERVETPSPR